MCFGNEIGFVFADHIQDEKLLFAPASGALILELNDVTSIDGKLEAIILGETTDRSEIEIAHTAMPLEEACCLHGQEHWRKFSQLRLRKKN